MLKKGRKYTKRGRVWPPPQLSFLKGANGKRIWCEGMLELLKRRLERWNGKCVKIVTQSQQSKLGRCRETRKMPIPTFESCMRVRGRDMDRYSSLSKISFLIFNNNVFHFCVLFWKLDIRFKFKSAAFAFCNNCCCCCNWLVFIKIMTLTSAEKEVSSLEVQLLTRDLGPIIKQY